MFYGRERELAALEKMYLKDGYRMAVVYGRRRIGKTALLNEFIKGKDAIYLPAVEVNDSLNLEKFSKILGEKIGFSNLPKVDNWNTFFSLLEEQLRGARTIVVIDEYPYAANANKSLNSILQHIIDYKFKHSDIFLILCGSSVSFMQDQVLGEKSPLFGRRTGQLKINPLDYFDAAKFYPNASFEEKIMYYSTIGGTPYYLSLLDPDSSFEENIRSLYFEMSGYLLNEGTLLMKQEFREAANYNAVLQAVASGANTLSEIVQFTRMDSSFVSKYLLTLQELDYIERTIPHGANPLKGKKSLYRISENFIAFWYRYVFSVRSEIERGNGNTYCSLAFESLNEFIGPIFEDITRQFLRRLNANGKLPFVAKSYGRWWGKDGQGTVQEVDIVVESIDGKCLIIGECKWGHLSKVNKAIETLEARAALFDKYTTSLYLFTKNAIKANNRIRAYSIEQFFA